MKRIYFSILCMMLSVCLSFAQDVPPANEIWYTTTDGNTITPGNCGTITSNVYENGKGVITFENSVTRIGYYAFGDCSGLTSVTIPNSVISIESEAFQGCSGLTSVTIPNSVISIGSEAFQGCFWLTSVTIPNSVTSIESYAFRNCPGLTKVNITSLEAWCQISFGDYFSNPCYYSHNLYINNEEIKDLVIPNSVTSIGKYTFYGCSGLISITIPNSVTSIGDYAFSRSGLTSIVIPNSVNSIGERAFEECRSLESINIPEGITTINYGTFGVCSKLSEVSLPSTLKTISSSAFRFTNISSLTIPEGVTTIGSYLITANRIAPLFKNETRTPPAKTKRHILHTKATPNRGGFSRF